MGHHSSSDFFEIASSTHKVPGREFSTRKAAHAAPGQQTLDTIIVRQNNPFR